MGGAGSLVRYRDTFYRVTPPGVSVVNTVGCGDCYLAGLLYGFARRGEIKDILRYAAAVSAAAAENPLSIGFSPERAKRLLGEVAVEEL
jgi:fructose-1-phosphate kinase PfkB-like protein